MTDASSRDNDRKFMQRCLALAVRGRGLVSPNPLVGAVIVKGGRIIGEGYHRRYGGPHAEVNAIRDAERKGKSIEGASIYVSLEPCFHHGNTPPCVDLLLTRKLKRVVVATTDPNPLVNGKSLRKLRRAGIECTTGVLKSEAERLNAPFFTFVKMQRPFIALKTAQTWDGFIAHPDGSSKWITNERSRRHVHTLRASFDAVLVGARTVAADDPMLTVRNVRGRNPLRIIVDGNLSIPSDAAVVQTASDVPTLIYTAKARTKEKKEKIRVIESLGAAVAEMRTGKSRRIPIRDIVKDLAAHHITSVLVEGGSKMYAEFFRSHIVDALYLYSSPAAFGKGIPGVDRLSVPYTRIHRSRTNFGEDILDEYDIAY
jgi:diaminohydroxyphosphoribosylaminopyrimidine deaminase / 5-amino-6-(5-phosphoribosylamino)uracil reductase